MSSETTQTLRSNIIAYWTGGDIEADYKNPEKPKYYGNCEARRAAYLKRLKGTLLGSPESGGKAGLWMKRKPITLYVKPNLCPGTHWPYTCFTEAKREESRKHMEHYGYLGFGFSREFILRYYGAPVLYVPGRMEMSMLPDDDTIISRHIIKIYLLSHFLAGKTVKDLSKRSTYKNILPTEKDPFYFQKFIKACGLQGELQRLYRIGVTPKEDDDWRLFAAIEASLITVSVYLKAMSEDDSSHPFELMDEFEWRIPYVNFKDCFEATGLANPEYVIPFGLHDLKVLVVPDTEVRKRALEDEDIRKQFGDISSKTKTVKEYTDAP